MTVEGWAALAAWVAAGVAVVSTALTLWLQWWRRTQPEWAAMPTGVTQSVQDRMKAMRRTPSAIGAEVTNVGDGTAFDVQVRMDGKPCEVIELDVTASSIRLMPIVGAVIPGARFGIVLPSDLRPDAEHLMVVVWTAAPTRLGRRWAQTIPLSSLEGFGARRPAHRADGGRRLSVSRGLPRATARRP